MPAPGKTKLIKFPPSRAGKDVKCPGFAWGGGGDVEASICLIHNRTMSKPEFNRTQSCTNRSIEFGNSYQIEVSFSSICPVIDHEFCHNIVKVAVDRQAPLTML